MVNWEQTVLDRYSDVISEKEEYREYEIELKKGVIPDDIQIETDTRAFSD